jgi:hypothetical protein
MMGSQRVNRSSDVFLVHFLRSGSLLKRTLQLPLIGEDYAARRTSRQ